MSVRAKFTPGEWRSLLSAPMLAAYAVAGAAPSKQDDFVREMAAVAGAVAEGEGRAAGDSLLGAAIADIVANAEDGRSGTAEKVSPTEVRGTALEACRVAAAALGTTVGRDAAYE